MVRTWTLPLIFAGLMAAGPAFGHAKVTASTPADGAVLDTAPQDFQISFDDPVVMTRLGLVMGSMNMPVKFERKTEAAKSFTIPLPALHAGQYKVTWGALSEEDGHAVTGSLSFTVKN
jgi:methionine-rich copper-binding protein CopC